MLGTMEADQCPRHNPGRDAEWPLLLLADAFGAKPLYAEGSKWKKTAIFGGSKQGVLLVRIQLFVGSRMPAISVRDYYPKVDNICLPN